MSVYKFRVWFEDHEDIYREIEIRANQTFADLHIAIQEAISFDNKHAASFFRSDDLWRKGEEIVLKAEDTGKGSASPKKIMNKCKLSAFIDDPHQKFIYLFDYAASWTFCIELMKILPLDNSVSYPRCVKSGGVAKKQYKTVTIPPVVADDDDDDAFSRTKKALDESDPPADDEAYASAEDVPVIGLEEEETADLPVADMEESENEGDDGLEEGERTEEPGFGDEKPEDY